MQRYFIPKKAWYDDRIRITGDDVHHITRVMRFTVGEKIICNDENGVAAQCEILEIDKDFVVVAILHWLEENNELPIEVTIVHGIPKADKFEIVLQKGTELGAHKYIPFQSERSIVIWDKKKWAKKLQRFNKIVKEASEQSHRSYVPTISNPMSITELIEESSQYDLKIFAYEEEAKVNNYHTFGSILKQINSNQKLLVCIGPEGGFSEEEANILKVNDFHPIRLGPRILRTETAPLYALSAISYHFEEQ
ncbi:16S rRNA (uracil(1498)-N(3))-methyltransferase [Oceanobacillus caeni]|uniref:Ribosomal RNA small subunit methyltransferase E n=1 Tax=Oceanobacillus caeni TaxID=405946 RepID=A0ABR5MJT6_9BACI|nr:MULTISPECIES: 16S rRNA (uracil(1498)-N(3))-methyltransferase [Bacillaceae]KKE80595.1 16S rRNA methyltransferase [Bacilli bacterium VT-13-104]PZD87840.1 16S rRNA (uracil(1498)-N(3))-methyltransferase [Bacilli bacterium]KPH75868.1 16S rRNA methyltransferase [Oceanobacillus caeni]MBU8789471.1 16S rRNA (uracil(1498)-N(3))-methyltransferase [Oceanobacillus caeni]MCR1833883.1 16S rRNA (uracil(1498)-N(3))-methyltransferase [Oceanobacillus caeni]